jgi:hypothetical protein
MNDETNSGLVNKYQKKRIQMTLDLCLEKEKKEVAGKKPNFLISDGAPNFRDAYMKEFWTLKNSSTHIYKYVRLRRDKVTSR